MQTLLKTFITPCSVLILGLFPGAVLGVESNDTEEKVPTQGVKVYQHMLPEKNSWFITQGKKKVCSGGPYTEWYQWTKSDCKLPAGSYSVTCCDKRTQMGWSEGYLVVDRKQYCGNYIFDAKLECFTEKLIVAPMPTPKPTPKPTPPPQILMKAREVRCDVGGGKNKCPKQFGSGGADRRRPGDWYLHGSYLSVGFNKYGVFGSNNRCNNVICPWGWNSILGLRQDKDGWGMGTAPTTGDFFLPGTTYYMFCIGYQGTSLCNDRTSTGGSRQKIGQYTDVKDESEKGSKILKLKMVFEKSPLRLTKRYIFNSCSKKLKIEAKLTNIGRTTLTKPYYLVGLDPDQDKEKYSDYSTINKITGQRTMRDAYTGVCAEGKRSRVSLCLSSTSLQSKAWHTLSFSRDPIKDNTGISRKGTQISKDTAMALGTLSANLGPGQSTPDIGMWLGLGSAKDVETPKNEVCS